MKNGKAIPSRRDFLRKTGAGTALVAMGGVLTPRFSTAAGHLPRVDPSDPRGEGTGVHA